LAKAGNQLSHIISTQDLDYCSAVYITLSGTQVLCLPLIQHHCFLLTLADASLSSQGVGIVNVAKAITQKSILFLR